MLSVNKFSFKPAGDLRKYYYNAMTFSFPLSAVAVTRLPERNRNSLPGDLRCAESGSGASGVPGRSTGSRHNGNPLNGLAGLCASMPWGCMRNWPKTLKDGAS